MRGFILAIGFIILISFCSAIPEINLQKEIYQPHETIIGTINNVNMKNDITRAELKIYDGRREISPEKEITYHEGVFYFYAIINQAGEYSINISSILYNDSGALKSASISKKVSVVENANKTQTITIRPGFYYGTNPEISVENSGNNSVNMSYDGNATNLLVGKSQKIEINSPSGLSFFELNCYEKFSIPIIRLNFSTGNITKENNITNLIVKNNETIIKNEQNLTAESNATLKIVVGKMSSYGWKIENAGSVNLSGLEIKTTFNFIENKSNFSFLKTDIEIVLYLNPSNVGDYYGNVSLYVGNKKITESEFHIFVFPDESSQAEFEQQIANPITGQKTCVDFNGTTCGEKQSCNGNFVALPGQEVSCCLGQCEGAGSEGNSLGIIIGLAIFACVAGIGYVLYTKSKKTKPTSPEEKFEKIEKNYEKKISGS
jgi:hypothetical protein